METTPTLGLEKQQQKQKQQIVLDTLGNHWH